MSLAILHVIISFHPNSATGGPTYGLHNLSQGLIKRGHRVSVFCTDRLSLKKKVELDEWEYGVSEPRFWDGIEVTYTKTIHPGYGGYGTLISLASFPYLYKQIQEYDVVHVHGTWSTMSMIASLTSKLRNVPYVVQLWNTFPIRLHQVRTKRIMHTLIRKRFLNHASAILALTIDEQNEYLASRPQDISKVCVVPSIRPLVKVPKRGLFRSEWGISEQDFIIIYLGRLHNGKGIEYIIQSLQFLQDEKVRLVIVGPDTGQESNLKNLVQESNLQSRVLFTGPIYGDEKFSAFRDADIFVLPSLFEQLPISALEAALCELPLMLSDRCGMTEIVTEANAGLIVPYGSSKILAEGIKDLYDKPEIRKQMGRNAKLMVEKHNSPEVVIDQLEMVYNQVRSA